MEREVCFIQSPLEVGALVRVEGLYYYIIGSGLTGWRPNPNKYATLFVMSWDCVAGGLGVGNRGVSPFND